MYTQQALLKAILLGVGVGTMALLSSPVKGQEIVNTKFYDGPYVISLAQPTPTVAADPRAVPTHRAVPTIAAVPTSKVEPRFVPTADPTHRAVPLTAIGSSATA
jgi:hypothetical protein